jgi:uncharacterized protein YhaN
MRFESLDLHCYGPFRELHLVFDPRPGRLNLLLAPNGAGKSVLREAFADLLFDIGHQSPMTFAYPATQMRILAAVHLADGRRSVLERRKGRGTTLAVDGAPLADAKVAAMLGGADRQLFADLFALDSRLLREGGLALSRSSGRLGQMLLAGSGGLGRVQALLRALVEERDEIGRVDRRHSARPLWRAAKEVLDAGREAQQAALRPAEWAALERRAEEAGRALARLGEERRAVESELARLNILRAVRPWFARREEAEAVLRQAGPVPRLAADFEDRWRAMVEGRARAGAALAECQRQHAEAEAALGAETVDARLLAAAERIEALTAKAAVARNAADDLPAVEAAHLRSRHEAARLRGELGWEAGTAIPPVAALPAARARFAAYQRLVTEVEATARELAQAKLRAELAAAELAALPKGEDVSALAALLRDLRRLGEPGVRLAAAGATCREAESAWRRALLALPGWPPERPGLAATVAPAESVLAAAEAALQEAVAAERDCRRQGEARSRQREQVTDELAALQRTVALPEPGALAAARAARDHLWDRFRRGEGEAVAFERALRAADSLADTLIAHATQAAEADNLRRQAAELAAAETQATAQACRLAATRAQAEAALAQLASAAGAPAGLGPAALRGFLAARGRALELQEAARRAAAEQAAVAAELASAGRRLAELGVEGEDLAAQIAAAEARLEAAAALAAARRTASAAWQAAQRERAEREAAAWAAQARLEAWGEEWRKAVAPLARPPGEPPEATAAALELIEQLHRAETAGSVSGARIEAMQATLAEFTAAAAALAGEVAPALSGRQAMEIAAGLAERLREERAARARQRAQQRTLEAVTAALAAARQATAQSEEEHTALCAVLGATDDAAAEACLQAHRRVREAEVELAAARGQIASLGGGRTEAELAVLLAGENAEAEEARIAALAERQQELARASENAAAEARSAADEMERVRADEGLLAAEGRKQVALAELARHSEKALLLHAAASLLRQALEAGAAAAGNAAVARAGALFRALTCGAYARLEVEEENGEQLLVAVEADGRTRKQIGELSEGSQDQMFLALRLAALEEYGGARPLLPFIADDVLQTFDDRRAGAALTALLGLAQQAQVFVLTHHPHVAELARTLAAGSVHQVTLAEVAA